MAKYPLKEKNFVPGHRTLTLLLSHLTVCNFYPNEDILISLSDSNRKPNNSVDVMIDGSIFKIILEV